MKNLKNILFTVIFLVLALGLVSTAHAAASFTVTDLDFGSDSQVRGEDITQTMTLTNTGDQPLTIDLSSKLPSIYDAVLSQSSASLNPNESVDVDVTITIPDSASSKRTEIKSGILATATNVASLTRTAKVYVTTESMLEITRVSIFIDDNTEKSLKEDDTYDSEDLKPGTPIIIRVYARNNFPDSADIDINDIEASVSSSGDLDLDDTQSISDLRTGDKDYAEFSGEIPSDAEDGDNYDIDINVEGQDDNGAWHYDSFSTEIEVRTVSDEVTIMRARISPDTISCSGKVTITADMQNTGRNNEANTFLLIENNQLDIMEKFYSTALNRDDTVTKTYSFNVNNKTEPGSYDFILTSFYGNDKQSDAKLVTLTVNPCQSTTTTTTTTPTTTVTQPTMPQVVPMSGATPAYGTASFTDSPTYLIILVAAIFILLLIVIILLVKYVF